MIYDKLTSRQQIDVAWLAIAQREEQECFSTETPELTMMIKNRIWSRGGNEELALLESAIPEYIERQTDQPGLSE
jgi:hypothetical protein